MGILPSWKDTKDLFDLRQWRVSTEEQPVLDRALNLVDDRYKIRDADSNKALTLTGQEILMQNLKEIHTTAGPVYEQSNVIMASEKITRVQKRNKYVLPCVEMSPESIIARLTDPTNMKPFHNATPAQLGSLQPTLRFFIVTSEEVEVTKNGKVTKEKRQKQEEVRFSDYTNVDRIVKLANARASNSVEDTLRRGGSEAGIRSFNWKYHNKHEGDKIIQADLELYFGTLSELVNLNYLSFLFTNGRKSSVAPKLNSKRFNKQERLHELNARNNKLLNALQPGSNINLNEKVNNDFRQLKVVVGWAVPEGHPGGLSRIYGSNWKQFQEAVKATQRVILLNLTNYDVNFTQEGPTTLKLEYVGSSDNFLGSRQSDILGQNNFTQGSLNQQQVMVSTEEIEKSKLFKLGYLKHQMDKHLVGELQILPVRTDRLNREHEYLVGLREYLKLQSEGSKPKPAQLAELKVVDAQINSVETIYKRAMKSLRTKRYSSLINNLIGGTGNASRVYMGTAAMDGKGGIDFKLESNITGKPGQSAADRARDQLNKLANLSGEERKKFLESNAISPNYTFQRGKNVKQGDKQTEQKSVKIPFVFLGDIILAALENADMRDDITFILGTYSPSNLGLSEFEFDSTNYPLYDIPIALDYISQFIYDNIISREIDEYPFRQFIDTLMSVVSRLLNNLSSYRLRISFDYTLYMTETEIKASEASNAGKDHLITKDRLNNIRANLKNELPTDNRKVNSYYIIFARQTNEVYRGNRDEDEKRGIHHYTLGADRGIAKNFNFSKQDVPQFKALNIEAIYSGPNAANFAQALILPQNVSIEMFGNSIHKNGDMIYVDSRAALGEFANQILALGGYYRVVRSQNSISSRGFTTTVEAVFQHRTNSKINTLGS